MITVDPKELATPPKDFKFQATRYETSIRSTWRQNQLGSGGLNSNRLKISGRSCFLRLTTLSSL